MSLKALAAPYITHHPSRQAKVLDRQAIEPFWLQGTMTVRDSETGIIGIIQIPTMRQDTGRRRTEGAEEARKILVMNVSEVTAEFPWT